ncbi:CCR4-NOT transcription complex subunit regena [Arctopsyche grandis]|uniref:CCR4-NOT transcription complex subunit regena n=1 Tax=Arctopsyche grandis TaxID=121162 RepID=UPI00406D62E6
MANLNFQQAPRSLGGGGVGVGGRAGGSSVGGAGFGGGGGVVAAPPPALPPPPTQLLPTARTALFNQRTFADRRPLVPSMMPSSNPMAVRGALSGSVMGRANDGDGAPPLLDPSEFPSLTARGHGEQPPHHVPPPGSKPYVGMVKQPTAEQNEFTMSSEDFPALPGTSGGSSNSGGVGGVVGSGIGSTTLEPSSNATTVPPAPAPIIPPPPPSDLSIDKSRQGVQTSSDGNVTNIPASMVPNQYGIIGLLTFIRAAESEPELVSLALGQDLTTLGLNLNSPDNLYLTFAGPWSDVPCRPQDIDYHVPPEYMINTSIREKLAPLKMNRYKDDLLFYLFYCFVGDILQVAAAAELYNREWRYHTEEKVWITQAPGLVTSEKTTTYERGTYYYFDAHSWRKVAKEFYLDYTKLEGRPQLPPHFPA